MIIVFSITGVKGLKEWVREANSQAHSIYYASEVHWFILIIIVNIHTLVWFFLCNKFARSWSDISNCSYNRMMPFTLESIKVKIISSVLIPSHYIQLDKAWTTAIAITCHSEYIY